jgi:hypothetical protein
MISRLLLAVLALCLVPQFTQAGGESGIYFFHHDWEIACDNTRTCRAAGYQSDSVDESPNTVLLTRQAGPAQPIKGQLMIGDDYDMPSNMPSKFKLSMSINGKINGDVIVHKESRIGKLSKEQVAALIAALSRNSTIEWLTENNIWRLSDKGAAAVLLKMDEIQGRIDTTGALIKKGPLSEAKVLPALSAPVVVAAKVAKPEPGDGKLSPDKTQQLKEALRQTTNEEDCYKLFENETDESELSISRLNKSKLLVSALCWMGAYNSGHGYWMINDHPPYAPVLITTLGTGYGDGGIYASQKGRGLGDCWSSNDWTWDGNQFIHTASSTTGMCRGIAAGGAWSLPTIVSKVRHK